LTLTPQRVRTALAIRRHPTASRAELKAFQDAQLRRLVVHAYESVPYYRKLFDRHRLHPRHIRGTVDLDLIPISSKQDFQSRPAAELIARGVDPGDLLSVYTNGSTGEPLIVRRTWQEQGFNVMFRERCRRAFGLGLRDRVANVGQRKLPDPKDKKTLGRALQAIGIHPRLRLDGMRPPEDIARELAAFQPQMLVAIPGMLCLVADHLIAAGRQDIRPRILVTGGEVLTPLMRQRLHQAFGVEPLQTYASHEFPLMGWECRQTGEMHTCDDGAIVEVVKNGRPVAPGESGEVVVTNLHAYAMPFIRYRLADAATRGNEQCACGQPFSTVRAIQGRMIDYFPLPDGRLVHPYEILRLIPRVDAWIRQYHLLQDRPDRIVMQVVPSHTSVPELQQLISRAVAPLIGPGIEFQVRMVDVIPAGPGGKRRHSCSLVASAYEGIRS
jgi:phenylacetate-CoA ligase